MTGPSLSETTETSTPSNEASPEFTLEPVSASRLDTAAPPRTTSSLKSSSGVSSTSPASVIWVVWVVEVTAYSWALPSSL